MSILEDYINRAMGPSQDEMYNAPQSGGPMMNDLVYRGTPMNALNLPYYGGGSVQPTVLRGPAPGRIERWGQAHPVPSGPQARSGGVPTSPVGPDVPQMNPDLMNHYLNMFGTSLPQRLDPNILFGNAQPGSFADRHQKIAGALDNAIGVLANMGPPGMTTGENMSNVARGLMGNRVAHQQNLTNQVMAPFAMAGQVNQLQTDIDAHNLSKAHQLYFGAMGAYHQGLLQNQQDRITGANSRANERAAATHPVPDGFGGMMIFNPNSETWEHSDFKIAAKDPIDGLVAATNKRRVDAGGQAMTPDEEANYRARLNSMGVDKPRPKGSSSAKVDPRDTTALKQAEDNFKQADGQYKEFFQQNGKHSMKRPEIKQQGDALIESRNQAAQHLQETQKAFNRKYPSNIGNTPQTAATPAVRDRVYNSTTGKLE